MITSINELTKFLCTPHDLKFYTTVFNEKLILTYPPTHFYECFLNEQALNSLVSYMQVCPQTEFNEYINFLSYFLNLEQLLKTIGLGKQSQALFLGSRLLNLLAMRSEHPLKSRPNYTKWCFNQLMQCEYQFTELEKLMSLDISAFSECLMTYTPNLQELNKCSLPKLRHLIVHGLFKTLPENVTQCAQFLNQLEFPIEVLLQTCLSPPAPTFRCRSLVLIAQKRGIITQLIDFVIPNWCLAVGKVVYQQTLTQILVLCALWLDTKLADKYSMQLIDAVTLHLQSTSEPVRKMGSLVAEVFAKQAKRSLDFEISYDEYWLERDTWGHNAEELPFVHTPTDASTQPEGVSTQPAEVSTQLGTPDIPLNNLEIDSDDEDNEEEKPIYFIKDLLEMLKSSEYIDQKSALTYGADLVLKKSQFGSEVHHHLPELVKAICVLQDNFSITKFHMSKQHLLNTVLAVDSDAAFNIANWFRTGDLSFSQKQSMLASYVYAAQSLANNLQPSEMKLLPSGVHELFSSSKDLQLIEMNKINNHKNIHKNMFSNVSIKYFNALLSIEPFITNSLEILIYTQWLRTLGAILQLSYPSTHIPVMVNESFEILNKITEKTDSLQLLEGVYTLSLAMIDVGAAILLRDHIMELPHLFDILVLKNEAAESVNGQRALVKFAELLQSVQTQITQST